MRNYNTIISKFNKKNILVVGDLILDQYIKGSVSRISPEAPVPVVLQKESFYTPGGAANVAANLKALGAKVAILGRLGDDLEGKMLVAQLKKQGIHIKGVFTDKKNPTITKTRVIAQHQQVVRIDRENPEKGIAKKLLEEIQDYVVKNIKKFDGIIISDYGKGIVTPELVRYVCSLAIENNKILTVDPKVEHFDYYREVTCITPNLKEAENAIQNIKVTSKASKDLAIHTSKLLTDKDIDEAGAALLKFLDLESLLITLGERGMKLFEKNKKPFYIKTRARDVYDVSGAGDAVISAFTLSLTAGAKKQEAADISNFAAGVVVGKMGAVAVTKQELLEAIKNN